jgi:hypothetical protein
MATNGPNAVRRSNDPCMSTSSRLKALPTYHLCIVGTLLWSISKSALDSQIIRRNLAATRKRASFPLFFPTGVHIREMEKFWHELQFNPVAPTEVPFKAELFRPAPASIHVLRQLSRKGRHYLEQTMRKQEGRPTLVLGLPNDAQDVAPLAALAHGPSLVQNFGRNDLNVNTTITPATESRVIEDVQGPVVLSDVYTVPLVMPSTLETNVSDGDDRIPEATITHLEEMLSEDQKRIAQGLHAFSAIQSKRARLMLSPPYTHLTAAGHYSKSRQLIQYLQRHLREAEASGRMVPAAEGRTHSEEGMGYKTAAQTH